MLWIALVLQVGLGLLFLFSGASKLAGNLDDVRVALAIPAWFWTVAGLSELAGAAGLLAGLRYPRLAVVAGVWLAIVMAGAVVSHLRVGDPLTDAVPAGVLMLLALAVALLRRPTARRAMPASAPFGSADAERAMR